MRIPPTPKLVIRGFTISRQRLQGRAGAFAYRFECIAHLSLASARFAVNSSDDTGRTRLRQ